MLCCGLRPGETDRVLYAHIDFEHSILYVDGTKTAAAKRYVPIPAELLAKYRSLDYEPFNRVFRNSRGDKLSHAARARMWRSFVRKMNIYLGCRVYRNQVLPPYRVADDLVPNCLRHTFATDLKDALVPDAIRKELMGHANRDVTDRYTHRTMQSVEIAAKLLRDFRATQHGDAAEIPTPIPTLYRWELGESGTIIYNFVHIQSKKKKP